MSTTVRPQTDTTTSVLDAARSLAPEITARAEEIERERRVALDLIESLTAAGCFRMMRPASNGGMELDLMSVMRVVEALGRADASTGWTVLIGAGTWLDLAGLPRTTFDEVFPPDRNVIVAGVFAPTGSAVPVEAGYHVNGRWSFASGCQHAEWLYGNCIDTSGEEPVLRITLFEPGQVIIEDTWTVSGLCGTGSHHFSIHDAIIPAERTYNVFADEHSVDVPMLHIPTPGVLALGIAAVAVGVAQGALDEVLALAADKVPLLSPSSLAGNPLFQYQVADADVRLRAARSLLYAETEAAWAAATAGAELTPELRARIRSAAVFAVSTSAAVIDRAYTAGGGSSLYATSPLQRRLRDIHAMTQHFLVKLDTLTTCGAVLAGADAELTIF